MKKLDINPRMFFEGIKTKENPYKKEVKFELSDFDNFIIEENEALLLAIEALRKEVANNVR